MRRLSILLFGAVLSAFLAGGRPAVAAVVPFTGALSITIGNLPPIPAFGGSGLATVDAPAGGGPVTSVVIPASEFAFGTFTKDPFLTFTPRLVVPVPNAFPIVQIAFHTVYNRTISLASGAGCTAGHANVSCPGGGLAGFGGFDGRILLGLFSLHTPVSGTTPIPVANLEVPLGVVGAGSTASHSYLGVSVRISGAGWTTGTVGVYHPTGQRFVHLGYTAHVVGSGSLYASETVPSGYGTTRTFRGGRETSHGVQEIALVTPVQIFTSATQSFIPTVARMTIHLVPEPLTLGLLGAGCAGLALYARRRRNP